MEPIALLVIDSGRISGYAMGVLGGVELNDEGLLGWGQCEHTRSKRDRVVRDACDLADKKMLPLHVLFETWNLGGKWSNESKLATGGSRGRWEDSCEQEGIPPERQHLAMVDRWRRELFGKQGRKMRSEDWKALAIARAPVLYKSRFSQLGDNAAEALCMLKWAEMRFKLGNELDAPK